MKGWKVESRICKISREHRLTIAIRLVSIRQVAAIEVIARAVWVKTADPLLKRQGVRPQILIMVAQ